MTDLSAYAGLGRRPLSWQWLDPSRLPRTPVAGLDRGRCASGSPSSCWPSRTSAHCGPARKRSRTGSPRLDAPYAQADWTTTGAYVYSPAFLQLVSPLQHLPWLAFVGVWTALLMLAVRYLTGPRLFIVGVLLASAELAGGNISLLLAVAIVLGFRWPAAWALILLTKVSPGIGLIWFAVRREWRNLAIALGATVIVVATSAAIMPWAWVDWIGVLTHVAGRDGTWAAVPIPFLVRLPFAIVDRGLGRPDRSALDGPGRVHAGAPGAVVRRPDDAPRDHRPARPGDRAGRIVGRPTGERDGDLLIVRRRTG